MPNGRLDRPTLLALVAMGLAVFVIANDITALTVALPQIEADPPRAGDTILMHDDTAATVELLSRLLPQWRAQGYEVRAMPEGLG